MVQSWNLYEVTTSETPIHGVMLRGRIRKLGLEKDFSVLTENASDKENCVRFAVLNDEDANAVSAYLHGIIVDVQVEQVAIDVKNPVLSKRKVNDETLYTL